MVGYAITVVPQRPDWLEALLTEKFFSPCLKHAAAKKNERNIFCLDCNDSICTHCLSAHRTHRLLQIRRYVYHDVIRLQDIQKLVDCALVQTYIINSARVVFLNQRPQPRPAKGQGNSCETCDRSLQDAYRYCSVACKVDAAINQGLEWAGLMPSCNSLPFTDFCPCSPPDSDKIGKVEIEEESSPNSVLDKPQSEISSASTDQDDSVGCGAVSSTPTPAPPLKKSRNSGPFKAAAAASPKDHVMFLPSVNRRKGTPHRSPSY